jgi:cell division septation protein DedD
VKERWDLTIRVQYGAFEDFDSAHAFAARLSKSGIPTFVFLTPDLGGASGEMLVVVSEDAYRTRKVARTVAARAKSRGIPAFVRAYRE